MAAIFQGLATHVHASCTMVQDPEPIKSEQYLYCDKRVCCDKLAWSLAPIFLQVLLNTLSSLSEDMIRDESAQFDANPKVGHEQIWHNLC